MIEPLIDFLAGIFEAIMGCDPDAPASDPCKTKARQYAAWILYGLIAAIIIVVSLKVYTYFKGKKG